MTVGNVSLYFGLNTSDIAIAIVHTVKKLIVFIYVPQKGIEPERTPLFVLLMFSLY